MKPIYLLIWGIPCLLPSVLTSYLEMHFINQIPGFYVSIKEMLVISAIITLFTMVYSIPIICLIYFKFKRKKLKLIDRLHLNLFLFTYSTIVFFIHLNFTKSLFVASYTTLPAVFLFFISLNIFSE